MAVLATPALTTLIRHHRDGRRFPPDLRPFLSSIPWLAQRKRPGQFTWLEPDPVLSKLPLMHVN
jgi:hypothetical protein